MLIEGLVFGCVDEIFSCTQPAKTKTLPIPFLPPLQTIHTVLPR